MSLELIQKSITDLHTTVGEKLDTATKSINENVDAKLKTAEAAIIEKADLNIKAVKDEQDKLRESFNEMKAQGGTAGLFGNRGLKSFGAELEEALETNKGKLGQKSLFAIDLQRKAVGDMSASNTTGSYFIQPDVRPGVVLRPYEEVHMRNIFPVGNTASNVIRHIRDNGGEGGPTVVAAGATKPQMDRDLSIEDAAVRKIATYLRVPEEMIEDIPYLVSFLSNIGTEEVLAVEDAEILYGDGTGQHLSGLFTNATAFAAGTAVLGGTPNRFDVLRAARLQMRKAKRKPSVALVSPLDWFMLTSAKDTTGNYILQGGGNGLISNIDGVPVIENTNITEGDFLLADRLAAEIDFRTNIQVRFYEQDQDNAIKNMVAIVIEERLALPIYYTNGLVKGTFSTAITDLTS